MATASRLRSSSPTSNRRRSSSPPCAASSPYFPPDLIPEIAKRLNSLQDFFALRAACRAYRAALSLSQSNLASQASLLVVATKQAAEQQAALLHLPLRRLLRFRLPPARQGTRSLFFSLGCRVAIRDCSTDPSDFNLRIVHLLTGEQTRLPNPRSFSEVLLSGDLVVTYSFMGRTIQCCRLNAAHWSLASFREPYLLQGLIFVSGTLYALVTPDNNHVGKVYRLAVVQLSDNRNLAELVFIGQLFDAQTLHLPDDTHLYMYLAECRGELILVSTTEFDAKVYHVFQWNSGEAKWVRISSFGGCTLFFSGDTFVGCIGPDCPAGIRKDCMYFNGGGLWREYSSVDASFHQSNVVSPGGKLEEDFTPAAWVFPSMC